METPGPTPRRRRRRREGAKTRIFGAYFATAAIVFAVMTFTTSELGVQADRDHQVVQAALVAQGHLVNPSHSHPAARAERPQLSVLGQSEGPGGNSSVGEPRPYDVQQVAVPFDAEPVDPHTMIGMVQRAHAANRLTELMIPAGVMIGVALAVVLGREVVLAARATRPRG